MSAEEHDHREMRCRLLGHSVPFKYCRTVADGMPCRLSPDCWHERFDIAAWLRGRYTAEQLEKILAPPMPKLASIVDLIEQAKQRAREARS